MVYDVICIRFEKFLWRSFIKSISLHFLHLEGIVREEWSLKDTLKTRVQFELCWLDVLLCFLGTSSFEFAVRNKLVVRGVVVDYGEIVVQYFSFDCLLQREELVLLPSAIVLVDLASLFIPNNNEDVEATELWYFDGFPQKSSLSLALNVDSWNLVFNSLLF